VINTDNGQQHLWIYAGVSTNQGLSTFHGCT